ncbi:cell cycle control protein [Paecilomyces variotii No. 5]|uniref:Cell cycle control protein n=1 Tax=Byssochlamys spectabilis (strain No. 5 / NBRC 109023) TaxID=1356009 RepID=V5HZA5_BYSSN|nr:cell cycle control protein [Paecilomyces variotii No. 5]
MPESDDLKAHAASSQDFYALLDVSPAANEAEIRRAYRRTALKYHPDKIQNPTPDDIEKFHVLQIAYDVLSDPSVRELYNNAREARERKKRETEMMDAAKRKMKEDLEARERAGMAAEAAQRGLKRPWMATGMAGYGDDAEAKLEREIERIAEDNRRRRREAEEKLKREAEEEEQRFQREEAESRAAADRSSQRVDRSKEGGTNVPELERAVKVRWIREGPGLDLDKDRLMSLFAPFGKVDNAFLLKDKRQRIGDKREKKKTVATGVVVYTSIVSAHSAVLDSEKKRKAGQDEWSVIESVFWASGNEPDLGADTARAPPTPSASKSTNSGTPPPGSNGTKATPKFNFPGLNKPTSDGTAKPNKAPSFASFSTAAASGPKAPPSAGKTGPSTPSLEEVTLMRLKNAQREKERRMLEEQIRKEDEAADAAEATAKASG